jgi:hypothetical protein
MGRTVCTLIDTVVVDMLKLSKGFDDVEVILSPSNHIFRSTVHTVIKHLQRLALSAPHHVTRIRYLIDMSPHFSSVVHSAIKHIHNIQKVVTVI